MDPVLVETLFEAGSPELDALTRHGVTNVAQLTKRFLDAQTTISSTIRAPGESASAAERLAFARKMGAPETVDGYGIPEASQQSQLGQTLSEIRSIACSKGMPVDTWEAIVEKSVALNNAAALSAEDSRKSVQQEWEDKAQEMFGSDLESVKAKSQKVLAELVAGDEDLQQILVDSGLNKHPGILQVFAKVAEITSPETAPTGLEGKAVTTVHDQAMELAQEIREINASPEYRSKSDPKHEIAVNRYLRAHRSLQSLQPEGQPRYEGCTDPRLQFSTDTI